MLRNRALMTSPFLHASFVNFMTKCRESEVVLPGLHPKWLAGSSWNNSAMSVKSSVTQADSILAIEVIRAMGWYAPSFM